MTLPFLVLDGNVDTTGGLTQIFGPGAPIQVNSGMTVRADKMLELIITTGINKDEQPTNIKTCFLGNLGKTPLDNFSYLPCLLFTLLLNLALYWGY